MRAWLCVATVVALTWLGGRQALAVVTWDTGYAMDGELEDKEIVLPISFESPSTDTMACTPAETDHWIDPDESTGDDSGIDADAWADWADTKCWWWAADGDVTQGGWTTTYQAPQQTGGIFRIECSIEDLPKQCTNGCRDDARAYAGTLDAGQMALQGGPPPAAIVYKAELQKRYDRNPPGPEVLSPTLSHQADAGDPLRNTRTTPATSRGFYKKIEWYATITPAVNPRSGAAYFEWLQEWCGEGWVDDRYEAGPTSNWEDDSPYASNRTNCIDADGRVYMLDSPGAYTYTLYWEMLTRSGCARRDPTRSRPLPHSVMCCCIRVGV